MGVPVKLMWHRADDARAGRAHPMATSRVRAALVGKEVVALQQSHTSVETDFRHGLGDIISASAADLPAGVGNPGLAETLFPPTPAAPYNFYVLTPTPLTTP